MALFSDGGDGGGGEAMTIGAGHDPAERAATGDVAAFAELVQAHQAMAFGYALAILGDFHLAQDATQEAFVAAYCGLPGLRDRAKFAGWLRGIVRHQCYRVLRRRRESPLGEEARDLLPAPGPTVAEEVEDREAVRQLLATIAALPEALRAITVLFYLEGRTQREVATFLSLPLTTVNNRLHAARRRLHERRLMTMAETFKQHELSHDFSDTVVELINRRGPILDLRFPEMPPALFSALDLGARDGADRLIAGVVQQLPDGVTRCLVLSPPDRGMPELPRTLPVRASGGASAESASPGTIRRALAALRTPSRADRVIETGLKAIDLLSPLAPGGTLGIFGDAGVGKAVLIGELLHNLGDGPGAASRAGSAVPTLFAFIERGEEVALMHQLLPSVPADDPARQALYVASDQSALLGAPDLTDSFDAVVYLSRDTLALRVFPAIDPLRCSSRLLTPAIVGEEHYRVACDARDLLARYPATGEAPGAGQPAPDDPPARRARQLRRFLGQPMFVAAEFSKLPGQLVPLAETIRGCAAILRGDCDGLPVEAFWMVGMLDEAITGAGQLMQSGGADDSARG